MLQLPLNSLPLITSKNIRAMILSTSFSSRRGFVNKRRFPKYYKQTTRFLNLKMAAWTLHKASRVTRQGIVRERNDLGIK